MATRSTAEAQRTGGRTDAASMRRANTGLILRHLRDQGGRSRARLAAETGLSKATMSTLIAELVERGLVVEGQPDRAGAVGRPGLTVTLDGRGVCGLGVEISVDYLSLIAVDLSGTVIRESTRPIDAANLPAADVIARVADLLGETLASLRSAGVRCVAITVAAPGFADSDTGIVRLASNLGWRDVALVDDLKQSLGQEVPPISAQHDAKLGAVAELAQLAGRDVEDLLYISGDVGVGGGIISGGQIMRGAKGSAGEIGHLPLDPAGRQCACGRRGCWETMVGLAAFLRLAADEADPVRNPGRPLEDRLRELHRRAEDGDERTLSALATVAEGLGAGVSILVDILDPLLVVLGGYFAWFEEWLIAPVADLVVERRLNPDTEVCRVVGSSLGLTSAARGGAHYSIDRVFQDPSVVSS
ncbi:ROK family transcriptional regulator [Pedococcus bigeumensis]|uniref:ROK family transcriptional regulator n=1 Tax=Pedococcus bigeumensis TaxID=433644 RepID=A0A502CKY4_9MICO|nr:ROK family transcriptional regulator [Pedococcus bigeumensis]TPG13887.1 ROK family transcriptional regulator [Pedococcus bigeumensis]